MTEKSVLACHGKVSAFIASQTTRSFNIDRAFKSIYATGKVHADLPKLIQVLESAGLIKRVRRASMYDAVFDVKWIATDTLLVICGDLINGQRLYEHGVVTRVDDRDGSFEMLLHCMLFNLRIQARKLGSDILLVIGDHEINSIFLYNHPQRWSETFACPVHLHFAPKLYDGEMTNAVKNRALMLAPFIMCSPFLMIRIGGIVLANGGFSHSYTNYASVYQDAAAAQTEIDKIVFDIKKAHEFTETTSNIIEEYSNLAMSGTYSVSIADVRGYIELTNDELCSRAETNALTKDGVDLVVVGQGGRVQPNRALEEDVKGCRGGNHDGCVIMRRCPGGLLVALVDTGISACVQKDPSINKDRDLEILELVRSNTGGVRGARDVKYDVNKRIVGPPAKRAFKVSGTVGPPATSDRKVGEMVGPPAKSDPDVTEMVRPPAKSDPDVTEMVGPPAKSYPDVTEMVGPPAKSDPKVVERVGPPAKREFKVSGTVGPPATSDRKVGEMVGPPAKSDPDVSVTVGPRVKRDFKVSGTVGPLMTRFV